MAQEPGPQIAVRLMGPLEITIEGQPISVDTRKALAIIALLAADRRPFARDELAAMFWPEADDEAARGALRRTLSTLRAALGDTGVSIDRSLVAIDPARVQVDLVDFERLSASASPADLAAAASLARGPFLAGFALRDSPAFDDWQAAHAVRLERAVAGVLDRLTVVHEAEGDLAAAIDAAGRRVELDPLDEPGHRRLIELLARSGDRAGAIRQYRSLVALFERELGVAPLRETSELYEAVREERAGFGAPPNISILAPSIPEQPRDLPLAGRERELATLRRAMIDTAPSGVVIAIEGEAGIGKTRLAEVAVAEARGRGSTVLAGRGYPGEAGIAYGPIAEVLRSGLAAADAVERLDQLDPTTLGEIGRLVELPRGLRVAPATSGGAGARVRLLDAITTTLALLAAGPARGIVWIDDLHLADDSTREVLAYLARRLSGRPVLVLLAWRHEDLTPAGVVWAEDMARIRAVSVLTLERLDRAAVAAIIRAARPADPPSTEDIETAVDVSEGLPLHVVEALATDGRLAGSAPRGGQSLLRDRISSVGETAGQVLAAAAVIGRSFDLSTVRYASGRSEEETVDALEELVRRALVRELASASNQSVQYDFSHGRLRETAYEAISLARRRLLHRRVAESLRLERSGTGADPVPPFALIAFHEREAGRTREAIDAFRSAADAAEALFATREAIDHLESCLALGDDAAPATHARIGELQARLGAYRAAIDSLETAAALAAPGEVPRIEIALGRVHRRRGDLAAAADHLDAALASPNVPAEVRALGLVERSGVALRAGDLDLAAATAAEARALAEDSGTPRELGLAERIVGLVALQRGALPEAIDALERSVALSLDDPDPTALVAARTGLALALSAAGVPDAAVAEMSLAIVACRQIGDRHLEAAVENHLADVLHDAGDAAGSMEHLKRAVALFAEVGGDAAGPDPGIWMLAAW